MNMLKDRKIIIIAIIIVVVVNVFNIPIPVLSKYNVDRTLNEYLKTDNISSKYNFKDNYYAAVYNGEEYKYDYGNRVIYDPILAKRFQKKIDKDYLNIKKSNPYVDVELPKRVHLYTVIDADDFDIKVHKLYVIVVKDNEKMSFEETKNKIADIILFIIENLGEDYNIRGLQFKYENLDGEYEVVLEIKERIIDKNIILKNVTRNE